VFSTYISRAELPRPDQKLKYAAMAVVPTAARRGRRAVDIHFIRMLLSYK
jgi:hypothetical protein